MGPGGAFTISPETTVLTGPLDKHGLVNYVAWFENEGKIPAEKNSAIEFLRILGPENLPPICGGLTSEARAVIATKV